MDDDENEGLKWRVWFGGDVQGLDSLLPDIVCLHSLRNQEARDASVSVMKDIQVRGLVSLLWSSEGSLINERQIVIDSSVDIVRECQEASQEGHRIRARRFLAFRGLRRVGTEPTLGRTR